MTAMDSSPYFIEVGDDEIREEPPPGLVASSSLSLSNSSKDNSLVLSSSSSSSSDKASTKKRPPFSWFQCGVDDYLTTCSDKGQLGQQPQQLQKEGDEHHTTQQVVQLDFEEAFNSGRLLPYLVDKSCGSKSHTPKATTTPRYKWNGHLPLEPVKHLKSEADGQGSGSPRRLRRNRSRGSPKNSRQEDHESTELQIAIDEADSMPRSSPRSQAKSKSSSLSPSRSKASSLSSGSLSPSMMSYQLSQPYYSINSDDCDSSIMVIPAQHAGQDHAALRELPDLYEVPQVKRKELFIRKLELCSVIFTTFDDPNADKRGKDMKRRTLIELVEYVNPSSGQITFAEETVMTKLVSMVRVNICRALRPTTDDYDPTYEDDEDEQEPAWPHLQVVYELFLRFVASSKVDAKVAKQHIDQTLLTHLIELLDSEDCRERDYVKTILHRIYGKFTTHRPFLRRTIANTLWRFVYETERHYGIGELLEVLGAIIHGFALPLKQEHLVFMNRYILPLHKPSCIGWYHSQLTYVLAEYIDKDVDTTIVPILQGLFKYWPWSDSAKQVQFLGELEEILEMLSAGPLVQVSDLVFTNLARCLETDQFQVVEKALGLWSNDHLVNSGCLSRIHSQAVLPFIYRPIFKISLFHRNDNIESSAQEVLQRYKEYDPVLYEKCTAAYFRDEEDSRKKLSAIEDKWAAIEQMAAQNVPGMTVK